MMLRQLRTFSALPISTKWNFLKIAVLVPLVEISIRTIKFKKTYRVLKALTGRTPAPPKDDISVIRRYRNVFYLHRRAIPYLGKCLSQSLTLWFLLERQGISAELKFGVKKEKNDLIAHAWIEYKGEAFMSESEMEENYTSFSESILAKIGD